MRRKQPPPTRKSPGFRALGRLFGRSRPRRFASRRDRGLPRLAGGESLEPKRLLVWVPTLIAPGVLEIVSTDAPSDILTLEMLDGSGSTIRVNGTKYGAGGIGGVPITAVTVLAIDPTPASDNDQLFIINSAGSPITTNGSNILFGGALPISTTNVEDFTFDSPVTRADISLDGPGPAGTVTVRNANLVTVGAGSPLRVGGLAVEAASLALNGPLTAAGSAIASGSVSLDIASPMTIAAPIVGSTTTGTITIRGNGGILQTQAGSLTAATLKIENVVAGNVDLDDAANAIGTLEITNRSAGGLVAFRDGDSLAIATVVANDGAVQIQSGGTLTLSGVVDAGDGTVSLGSRNGMAQTAAGAVIGTTLTLSNGLVAGGQPASGAIALDTAAGNRVEIVAAVNAAAQGDIRFKNATALAVGTGIGTAGLSAVGGVIAVTSAGSLTLDQPITAADGGSVALTAVSGITQAGSAVVTSLALAAVNTGADGAVALDAAENAVTFIGGSNTAGDGGFAFRGAGGLTVSTAKIDVGGAGRIALFSKGSIDQVGILSARELLVVNENTEGGSITLDLGNTVGLLAVQNQFDAGSVSFTNAAALAIAGIGLDAAGNDLRLRVAGGVSQSFETSEGGAIIARSLRVVRTDDGVVDLQNPENDVDALGATLGGDGDFLYGDADGFNVGVLPSETDGLVGDGVNVTLAAGGSITQTGRIAAASVRAFNRESGEGDILLDLATNTFTTFTAANAFEDGTVVVAAAGGLTIGADGIAADGNMVTVAINSVLGASGDLNQDGRVIARSLLIRNASPAAGGDLVLDLQDNLVESFAAANDSSTGTIVFSNAGLIAIDAAGVRGRAAITLEAVGGFSQSGTITTAGLLTVANLDGSGGDVLLDAHNDVGTLVGRNANPLGSFSFTDATDLVIGDAGIAAGGNAVALTVGGSLSQSVTATAGIVGDSLTITNVNPSSGSITLGRTAGNSVGTLTATTAYEGGKITYVASDALTIGDDGINAPGNDVAITVTGNLLQSSTAPSGIVARSLTLKNESSPSQPAVGSFILAAEGVNDVDILSVENLAENSENSWTDVDGVVVALITLSNVSSGGDFHLITGGLIEQSGGITARHFIVETAEADEPADIQLGLNNQVSILSVDAGTAGVTFGNSTPVVIGNSGISAAKFINLSFGGDLVQDTRGTIIPGGSGAVSTEVLNLEGSGNVELRSETNTVDELTMSLNTQDLGASATSSITLQLSAITILNPGRNYTSTPRVLISGGGGSGASAVATLNNQVTAITVPEAGTGTGYLTAPTVTITGGGGSGATATATVSNGRVTTVNIINPGSGYTFTPTVVFSGGGGSGAVATAEIGGIISAITITNPGSGYTAPPNVTIDGGGGGQGFVPADAAAQMNGIVSSITVDNPGSNYISPPNVIITGGGGSGAAARAIVDSQVDVIRLTNPGQNYLFTPTVTLSGGGGSGAQAIAIRESTKNDQGQVVFTGRLSGFTITDPGTGYTSAPTVTISGGGGSGATATAGITGTVSDIVVTNPGSGYTSAPTITLTSGGNVQFVNSNGLLLGRRAGTDTSIEGASSNVTLTVLGDGGITQTGSIQLNGGSLTVETDTGDIALQHSKNSIVEFNAVSETGRIALTNAAPLAVGSRGISTAGDVSLNLDGQLTIGPGGIESVGDIEISVSGNVSQTGRLRAEEIRIHNTLPSAGSIQLELATNEVERIAIRNDASGGSVTFQNSLGLEVIGVVAGGAVTLSAYGDLSQSGRIVSGDVLTVSNLSAATGSVVLDDPGNRVAGIAGGNANVDGGSKPVFSFTNSGGMTVGGIAAPLSQVSLVLSGNLLQSLTAGGVVSRSLDVTNLATVGGQIQLENTTNRVSRFSAANVSASGVVTFSANESFSVGDRGITAPSSFVTLSTSGTINQDDESGPILARTLELANSNAVYGQILLRHEENDVDQLSINNAAKNTVSSVRDSDDLTISADGINAAEGAGDVELSAGGTITQLQNIVANSLSITTTSGSILLTNTGNSARIFNASNPDPVGSITYASQSRSTLTIGKDGITAAGDVTLAVLGGVIQDSITGGRIEARNISVSSSNNLLFRNTENAVDSLSVAVSGTQFTGSGEADIDLSITGVEIRSGGSGYTTPPAVTISGGGGSGAAAFATVVDGVVTRIEITNSGSGYTSTPTITVAAPTAAGGVQAQAALRTNGFVTGIRVTDPGSGFITAPRVTLSGGGGSGATATATITSGITSFTLTDGGLYQAEPQVLITGGGGSGAIARAILDDRDQTLRTIVRIEIINRGSGYTDPPTITFSGGGGSGASAAATISGYIQSFTVTNPGSGYVSAPTVTLTGGADITWTNSKDLVLGRPVVAGRSISTERSVDASGSTFKLSVTGAVSQTGDIFLGTAGELDVVATGDVVLLRSTNQLGSIVAEIEEGSLEFAGASTYRIGERGITAGNGDVLLRVAGDLSQSGRVVTGRLVVDNTLATNSLISGAGSIVLELPTNDVSSFSASNLAIGATIAFRDADDLDVAGVRATGAGEIRLTTDGNLTQSGSIVTLGRLTAVNASATTGSIVLEDSGNSVAAIAGGNNNADVAGSPLFVFVNAGDLSVQGIAAAVSAVDLTVTGHLTQTAPVLARSLALENRSTTRGLITLTNAANDTGLFSAANAFTKGSIAYTDLNSITLGEGGIDALQNAVTLAVTGNILQDEASGSIRARSLVITNASTTLGLVDLEADGNDVDLLAVTNAGVSATTAFADIDGLTIAAGGINAAAGAGNVRLVAGGTLDQLGIVTARHLAVSSAAGSVLLSLANDVDILDAETLDAAGVLSFTAAGPLEIGDVGILAAGVANLTVGGDLVQAADTSGAVTATTLNLVATKAGSGFGLVGPANDVDVLTASIAAGSLDFVDVDDLVIGRLTGSTVGFKAAGSAVRLTVAADGGLTQTGSITADSLAVASEDGDISLGLAANSVKVITGASLTGSLLYRNATALSIGDAGIATEGDVSLTTIGAITQTGAVAADALSVTNLLATAGAITLDLADNDVASFAAVNKAAAAIVYRDASDFTIGAAGVSTRSDITLTSAGDMLQGMGSGAIAGTQLTLLNLNEQFGSILLANPLNSIVSITATNEAYDGDIVVNDTNGLSVVGTGVRSNLGDISLATTGALSLAADVFADQDDFAPSRVTLSATRGILQPAGAVTANQLSLSNASSSPVTLAQAANNVANLAATSIGNITYVDADSFETGILSSKVKSVEVSTKGVLRLTALGDVLRVVGGLDYAKSGQTGQLFLSVGADDQIGMVELVPTSQGDNPTAGSAFAGTLRDMITYANQNRVRRPSGATTIVQPQTVVFDESTVNTISVTQPLQAIAQPLAFDGSRVASNVITPRVGLNGAGITTAAANGLTFLSTAAGSSVTGMAIHGFTKGAGIQIQAANTTVTNTFFGLNRDSKVSANLYGIDLPSTLATGVTIGGAGLDAGVPDPTLANVFASNTSAGVFVRGGASGNSILGNYIGTDADGRSLGNREGVVITAATGTLVSDNVVSFNKLSGVSIAGARATATLPNVVERNVVTSNGAGGSTAASAGAGIRVSASAFARIGREGAGNVVGLNGHGIVVQQGSTNTTISGNAVGTSALFAGEPIANRFDGIRVVASTGNLVGGLTEESRNEIAFNGRHGLDIENALAATTAAGNQILSNRIFANTSHGVRVSGGGRNVIGTGAATANAITSNGGDGIRVEAFGKFGSIGNLIQGNLIGTDSPLDDTALGNAGNGLTIIGGSANVVDRVNVIRFNAGYGVRVEASSSNVIGSSLPDEGNIISDNGLDGILITSGSANRPTTGNAVSGNEIGENGGSGIAVSGSNTKNTIIGTNTVGGVPTGQPNVIVDNGGYGVNVTNGASQVQIQGNEIEGNTSGGINTAPGTQQGVRPPTLSSAVIYLPPGGSPQLLVEGTATGVARQRLMISIYATPAAAPGGPPVAGLIYLGSVTVVIGTSGTASFRATLTLGEAIEGDLVTATTTTLTSLPGNTSQFSSPAIAIRSPTVPDVAAPPNSSGGSPPGTGSGSGGTGGVAPPPRTL